MTFLYSIYGLRLRANLAISSLVTLSDAPSEDVQAWLGLIPPWLKEMPEARQQIWYISPHQDKRGEPILVIWSLADGTYFRLSYNDGTEFFLDSAGTRIWAAWPDAATLEDTATYLLGPVLGFLLRLRGVACLHASAISVGDRAIALLGSAGAGKSMTAAAFATQGCPVLSDDVVALSDQGDAFLVQPGYTCLRLWPDSVNSLYGSSDALPRLTPSDGINAWWDKRYLDLRENGYRFQQKPLPLAAVYILDGRSAAPTAPFVETVSAHTGLITLIANTFMNYVLDRTMRAEEFELLGRLVDSVQLRRVRPHEDSAYLLRLCDVILNDFQALTASALGVRGVKLG